MSWSQLEPGVFEMRHRVLNAHPLEISSRSFNLGFNAEACVAPYRTVFGLLADPQTRARWFGAHVDKETIAASSSSIDVRTEGPSSFYQVGLDLAALARQFPNAPDVSVLLQNPNGVTLVQDRLHATLLRSCIRRGFSVPARVVAGTLIPLLAAAIESLDKSALVPSKSLSRRLAAVRSCEAYMRQHTDATVTLLDLSAVSGMRSRSLINAFEAVTGFSPMDYLKRLRLSGVHRALQRADKARTRVIDVASAWGFWHMGHFATDYRAMFGEAPSQTLLK
jgi:AraC-like DNA-binding protein